MCVNMGNWNYIIYEWQNVWPYKETAQLRYISVGRRSSIISIEWSYRKIIMFVCVCVYERKFPKIETASNRNLYSHLCYNIYCNIQALLGMNMSRDRYSSNASHQYPMKWETMLPVVIECVCVRRKVSIFLCVQNGGDFYSYSMPWKWNIVNRKKYSTKMCSKRNGYCVCMYLLYIMLYNIYEIYGIVSGLNAWIWWWVWTPSNTTILYNIIYIMVK